MIQKRKDGRDPWKTLGTLTAPGREEEPSRTLAFNWKSGPQPQATPHGGLAPSGGAAEGGAVACGFVLPPCGLACHTVHDGTKKSPFRARLPRIS